MIWFTLGNISVVGTYYTHGLNLTPRGLLAVTAAASLLSCAAAAAVPYCRKWPRVGYSCGGLSLSYILSTVINKPFTAASSLQLAAYPRGQLAAVPAGKLYSLTARGQLLQLRPAASCQLLELGSSQLILS